MSTQQPKPLAILIGIAFETQNCIVGISKCRSGYGWKARDAKRGCILAVRLDKPVDDPFDTLFESFSKEVYSESFPKGVLNSIYALDNGEGSPEDVDAVRQLGEMIGVEVVVEENEKLWP